MNEQNINMVCSALDIFIEERKKADAVNNLIKKHFPVSEVVIEPISDLLSEAYLKMIYLLFPIPDFDKFLEQFIYENGVEGVILEFLGKAHSVKTVDDLKVCLYGYICSVVD